MRYFMGFIKRRLGVLGACALALGSFGVARGVDVSAPVILQWYESTYETMEHRMADFFKAGYGAMWTPPPGKADLGDFSVGYDVYDRFNLGNPDDKTLYGTETGLKRLVRMVHRGGGDIYVDYVINHNGFSDLGTSGFAASGGYPGFYLTHPSAIDGDFHSPFAGGDLDGRLAGLIDIDHSKNLQAIRSPVPGFANNLPAGTTPFGDKLANVPTEENRRFYPDRNLQPIMVFDPSTGEANIPIYPFNTNDPMAGDPVSENAMGYLMRYAQWMVQSIGVDGFRIDAAKHVEPFALNFFDRAVYRSSQRVHLDGSTRHVFSFSEVFDGSKSYQQSFIRKDINNANPGVIGGNRDVLDFPLFFAMQANLTGNGFQNDWRNIVGASQDSNDDGLANNGSQGVAFVQSHDSFGPHLGNVAHAFVLMRPGNAVVYFNAKEFGNNRDFPKSGRGDALGGTFGDRITDLVEIRNTHGRGDYIQRYLDKELLAYEREGSALVLLSNRLDSGFDSRTVDINLPFGTYLIEMTGNANADPGIPKVIQVFDDCFGCQTKVNVRFLRNDGGDQGYLIYGLATPQGSLTLTNVDSVLMDDGPKDVPNAQRRIEDLHVIKADSFQVRLQTQQVNLLGLIRDMAADGDNALIRIDGGRNINGNSQIDFRDPNNLVTYGFETFVTKHSDLYTGGDGEFRQTIDTTGLSEGEHYIEVRAFRHREDGGPAVYSSFKKVIYLDRLPPESAVESFTPFVEQYQDNRKLLVRSIDQTANSVHVFLDLPAGLDDEEVAALVGGGSQSIQIDRDLFQKDYLNLTHGNHVVTVVSFERTGTRNVQRFPGYFMSTIHGRGLGDLDFDGQFEASDVNAFEGVLWSRNEQFNPAADLNGDGLVNHADLLGLGAALATGGADGQTLAEARAAVLRRIDFNFSGQTSINDLGLLYDQQGGTEWLYDLNDDGMTTLADIQSFIFDYIGTGIGDANLDGLVNLADYTLVRAGFGAGSRWQQGDFDFDGDVDFQDLRAFKAAYPGGPAALAADLAAVPVPAAWAAGAGLLGMMGVRRRRR